MYIPEHFRVDDSDEIKSFIEHNGFGQLVSTLEGRLFSTHLPFLLAEDGKSVLGHLAKQNPQHAELEGQEVLLTLQGPHDYISPSWYTGPGVPTWNYQAVHIYGQCEVFTDVDRLQLLVDSLTKQYESGFARPWQPDYKSGMLTAIVGIDITIREIQCKYKLSQNRPQQDRERVIEELEALGSVALAQAMRGEV